MTVRVEVPAALDGERLDRVIALETGWPRSEVADLIAAGSVRLRGDVTTARSTRVTTNDVIDVEPAGDEDTTPEAGDVDFTVVHADAEIIVVDKPAGVVVHPGAGRRGGTLVNGLIGRYPELAETPGLGERERPGIVHRLDAGTSGLIVVARTPEAYASLVGQLKGRAVGRVYAALVLGAVEAAAGVVDAPVGRAAADRTRMAVAASGRDARTHYIVVERIDGTTRPYTLVECRLETGRTHQIRVHMSAIGHPVAGDARYGGVRADLALSRPFLHAHRLAFDHPATGARVTFESPLPPDLAAALTNLRQ
jgi:23S rRNA pseudouridine1911/1915/1917 synthase